jgi:hypothetical protein
MRLFYGVAEAKPPVEDFNCNFSFAVPILCPRGHARGQLCVRIAHLYELPICARTRS